MLESATQGNLTEDIAVETVQTALKLLGNASCHLAVVIRRSVLNPNLKKMAEEDKIYKGAAPNLFGDSFLKKAKERDDELKVLHTQDKLGRRAPTLPTGRAKTTRDAAPLHRLLGVAVHSEATTDRTPTGPTKRKVTDQPPDQPKLKNFGTAIIRIPSIASCDHHSSTRKLPSKPSIIVKQLL